MKERYVSYKPSGIDWIGDIPSHWEVMPLKRKLAEPLMYGANEPAESEDIEFPRYIRITDIDSNGNLRPETFKSLEPTKAAPYLLKKGDVLFARSGATVGKTYIFKETYDACFAGYLIKASCATDLSPQFLYYFTLSGEYENWKNSIFIQATIQNIGADKYSLLPIPIPLLPEQEAIASWLDEKCGEIDAAIVKVDREIELIDELKQSEISRVVTRGLNPDAPLRPSGIDWIGDVPEHWNCVKMSRILKGIQDGTHGTYNRVEDGKPLLSAKNVFEDGINITENESQISQSDFEGIVANGYPRKGDIALCCVATIGRGCIYPYDVPMAFQRSVTFLRIHNTQSNKFILYYLRSVCAKVQFEIYAKTSAQSGVYMGDLKKFLVLLPPLSEQEAIADYLDRKCAEIDGLKEKLEKKRETLKELRQSIISEVVTGKRKVI